MQFLIIFIAIYGFFAWLGYRYKTNKDQAAWLYAEKKIPKFLTGISTAATSIGGSATVILGYMIYTHGWAGLVIDIPVGIGILFLGLFFAKKIREENVNTVPEYLGNYYGETVRKISAVFIVITELAWFGLLIKSFSMFIPVDIIIDEKIMVIATGFFFLFYVYFSGQRGVYFTDLVQGLIIIGGLLVLLLFTVTLDTPTAGSSYSYSTTPLPVLTQIGFFSMMFLSGLTGPDILSRVFYAKDPDNARIGIIWGASIKIVISIVIGFIAYRSIPHLAGLDSGYRLFPHLISHFFTTPIDSIFQIIFLLIMVSSADTVLMTAITTLNNDILINKNRFINLKTLVWLLGFVGIFLALFFNTILDLMKTAYTFYAAGPAIFVIYSLFKVKIKPDAATKIIFLSGTAAILMEFWNPWQLNSVLSAIALNIVLVILFNFGRKELE